jgi:hypothetical protein
MEYITKEDLEEYIDIIPSENGDDDYDTRTVLAKNIFEWLKDKKFKQDLEVDRTQFGTITSFFAAERVSKLIELLGEVEQLWSYYFMPKDLIVNFNDSSNVYELQEVLEKELSEFYKREFVAYNKNLKIKEHTLKPSRIGLKEFQVAEDKY